MMREFNTFGPVNPQRHYHVNRVAVKAALRAKIERGRYMTLNASRQTGKTTLFREIIAELEAQGNYFGILLNFEALSNFAPEYFYEQLQKSLITWRVDYAPTAPEPSPMRHQGDFTIWLEETVHRLNRRGILIIDEFDSIPVETAIAILSQFRAMYLRRDQPSAHVIHSILLVGVRTIPSLLGGTQSPFNIADQFIVPYFTPEEVTDLLTQHTQATGQVFEADVIAAIVHETEGQPFLVNRLGQLLTVDLVPDVAQPITATDLDYALIRLVNENNTHFASIRSKANLHRHAVLTALFNPVRYYDFQDEVTQDLAMYGVFRVLRDEHGVDYARMANPLYRKMLIKAFAPTHDFIRQATNGGVQQRYLVEGLLNFDQLLDHFKAFMEEHGVRLLKSEKSQRPLEISGQYLLFSYLTAALQSVGGYVVIESVSSAGEIDLLAFHRGQRFIIETKIWYSNAKYEAGKTQLVDYLRAAGLEKGYLVIFDENLTTNPLLAEGDRFELTVDSKILRVYLIGVTV
ncbi:MAG: AAA-like domain-containing protein [Caldilineaceae bacterium]